MKKPNDMRERFEVRVDGSPIGYNGSNPVFEDIQSAILKAEKELAWGDNREPCALPWVPTVYGWVSTNGRAQVVRVKPKTANVGKAKGRGLSRVSGGAPAQAKSSA